MVLFACGLYVASSTRSAASPLRWRRPVAIFSQWVFDGENYTVPSSSPVTMKHLPLVVTVLLVACLTGCELLGGSDDAEPVIIVPFGGGDTRFVQDALRIEQVRIRGDVLLLDVAYSGGCTDHAFAAYSSGPIIRTSWGRRVALA